MARPILHYFGIYGRGEVIRVLFIHHKADFEDHLVSFEEWPALKTSGFAEFGQLPMVEIDGLKLVQTKAILHYLGEKFGYIPRDPVLRYKMESTLYLLEDFINGMISLFSGKDMEALTKYYADNAARYLGYFNARLTENHDGEGWYVGEALTLTDLIMFEWLWDFFFRAGREQFAHYVEAFPKLKAHFDRVLASSPELAAHHASRPVWPF